MVPAGGSRDGSERARGWPVGASGEGARLITYKYAVEYDRQYVVSLPSAKQSLQEEFKQLQRHRQKR